MTYTPGLNMTFCKKSGIDVTRLLNNYKDLPGLKNNKQTHKHVSVPISAAINAYARMYMH